MFDRISIRKMKPFVPLMAMVIYFLIMSVFGLFFHARIAIGALFGDLTTILVFGYLYSQSKLRRSTMPLFRPQTWFLVLAVGFLGFVWIVSQTAAKGLYELGLTSGIHHYQDAMKNDATIYILTSVFVAPVAEELVFRAFGYVIWRKYFKHSIAAILVSGLFALFHMTFVHLPIAFCVGLLSALLYEMTGHIRYGILMHFLYNLFSAGIVFGLSKHNLFLQPFVMILYMGITIFILCRMITKAKAIRQFADEPKLIDKLNQKP